MSKRRVIVEPEEEPVNPVQKTVADSKSNVVFLISILCIRCSRMTQLVLHSRELPEWVREFLLTVRWDKPDEPFTEANRSQNWDKDKEAMKRGLQLQLLCESPKVKNKKKTTENKCLAPDHVLKSLRKQYPTENIQPGMLYELNQKHIVQSMGQVITAYGELISAEPKFIMADTVLSVGRISIMEHWRDEVMKRKADKDKWNKEMNRQIK